MAIVTAGRRNDAVLSGAVSLDVQIASDAPDVPAADDIRQWLIAAYDRAQFAADRDVEIAVRVVDEDEIRTLNRDFRQQDMPTNVLSFPAAMIEGLPQDQALMLGDIVVCASIVRAEAAEQGKPIADHWAHMLVHGTLHLLGYDHMTELEAAKMEGLESQILIEHGIADPYGAS
jgi:probable rRNA maturation factor